MNDYNTGEYTDEIEYQIMKDTNSSYILISIFTIFLSTMSFILV